MVQTTISIQIEETRRKEWEEYLKNRPEIENFSQLIRVAVSNEIADTQPVEDNNSLAAEQELSDVVNGLNSLKDTMQGFTDQLAAIEEGQTDKVDMSRAVLISLPAPPSEKPVETSGRNGSDRSQDSASPTSFAKTAEELAYDLNTTTDDIESALHHLQENTGQVKTAYCGSPPRRWYWKSSN